MQRLRLYPPLELNLHVYNLGVFAKVVQNTAAALFVLVGILHLCSEAAAACKTKQGEKHTQRNVS